MEDIIVRNNETGEIIYMIRDNVKSEPLEQNPNLMHSYSINKKKIRPVVDQLGKTFDTDALYDDAVDIKVGEEPRFRYKETDEDIETIKLEIEQTEVE